MRRETPDHDDLLEPLPIFVDGVAIAPVYASRETHVAAASPCANELIEATPAATAEPVAVRALLPWSGPVRPVAPVPFGSVAGAFSRMIALRASLLDSLPDWWQQRARDERVEIAQRLFLERPRRGRADTWRMRGSLRSPWRPRSIPFELLLWPRFDTWTKLSAEPRRGVHFGRRYFTNGHEVLDALCAELIHELSATRVVSTPGR